MSVMCDTPYPSPARADALRADDGAAPTGLARPVRVARVPAP